MVSLYMYHLFGIFIIRGLLLGLLSVVLRIDPMTSDMQGKCSPTESH